MKPFKTIQEQIAFLQSRGLVVDDTAKAEQFLLFENYYNVVNGYKELFYKAGEADVFEEETTFEELEAAFKFDAGLRSLFLTQLLHIENNIKTLVAYVFSKNHGENRLHGCKQLRLSGEQQKRCEQIDRGVFLDNRK